jgi:hypothetical protein
MIFAEIDSADRIHDNVPVDSGKLACCWRMCACRETMGPMEGMGWTAGFTDMVRIEPLVIVMGFAGGASVASR